MARISLGDLPHEVLRKIPIQQDDSLSLILVNHHFRTAYTPRLYEKVKLDGRQPISTHWLVCFLRTITTAPHLAALVRDFDFRVWNLATREGSVLIVDQTKAAVPWFFEDSYHKRDRHYVRLQHDNIGPFLLSNLPNLTTLDIEFSGFGGESSGLYLPKLTSANIFQPNEQVLASELACFLRLPQLKVLTIQNPASDFSTHKSSSLPDIRPKSSELKSLTLDFDMLAKSDLEAVLKVPRSLEELRLFRSSTPCCPEHSPSLPAGHVSQFGYSLYSLLAQPALGIPLPSSQAGPMLGATPVIIPPLFGLQHNLVQPSPPQSSNIASTESIMPSTPIYPHTSDLGQALRPLKRSLEVLDINCHRYEDCDVDTGYLGSFGEFTFLKQFCVSPELLCGPSQLFKAPKVTAEHLPPNIEQLKLYLDLRHVNRPKSFWSKLVTNLVAPQSGLARLAGITIVPVRHRTFMRCQHSRCRWKTTTCSDCINEGGRCTLCYRGKTVERMMEICNNAGIKLVGPWDLAKYHHPATHTPELEMDDDLSDFD